MKKPIITKQSLIRIGSVFLFVIIYFKLIIPIRADIVDLLVDHFGSTKITDKYEILGKSRILAVHDIEGTKKYLLRTPYDITYFITFIVSCFYLTLIDLYKLTIVPLMGFLLALLFFLIGTYSDFRLSYSFMELISKYLVPLFCLTYVPVMYSLKKNEIYLHT